MYKIDLSRFLDEKEVVIPIFSNKAWYDNRRLQFFSVENGWYYVCLSTPPKILRQATQLEVYKILREAKPIKVYALGSEGIPLNFDQFFKQGLGEAVQVAFMELPIFSVAKIIPWGDGTFYFFEQDARETVKLKEFEILFREDKPLTGKGITPELRYYWLLLSLQKQAYEEYQKLEQFKISEAERLKRLKEFESSWPGRLQTTIDKAHGVLLRYYKSGNNWTVHWRVKDSDQIVKSTIRDDLRILNLGFCASGDDKRHTLASAVQLAKMYGRLHITRE